MSKMKAIAEFEKVSFEQFKKDWLDAFTEYYAELSPEEAHLDIKEIYEQIKLPTRATKGSAGYDFYAPTNILIRNKEAVKIPTGIRCKLNEGLCLILVPRSGLGFKYGLRLANGVGVIDEDFAYTDTEGHIMVKYVNDCTAICNKDIMLPQGKGFVQGLIFPYYKTDDDGVDNTRIGGFGSTDGSVVR